MWFCWTNALGMCTLSYVICIIYCKGGVLASSPLSGVLPGACQPDAVCHRAIVAHRAAQRRLEQSRVSHNLACLLNCGFVEWEWRGKNRVYRLNPDLGPILTGIEKHLHRYAPALDSCGVLNAESGLVRLESQAASRPRRAKRMRSISGVSK